MPLSGVASSARQDTGNQSQQYCLHIPRNPTVTNSTDRRISSQTAAHPLVKFSIEDYCCWRSEKGRNAWVCLLTFRCVSLAKTLSYPYGTAESRVSHDINLTGIRLAASVFGKHGTVCPCILSTCPTNLHRVVFCILRHRKRLIRAVPGFCCATF